VSLKDTLISFWQDAGIIIFSEWSTLIGVLFLYYPGMIFGTAGIAIVNIIVLTLSFYFFQKSILSLGYEDRKNSLILLTGLLITLGNFVLIELMLFPSKEIPLILLTNIYMYLYVVKKNLFGCLLVSMVAFFFRDGYGLILAAVTIFLWLSSFFSRKQLISSLFLLFLSYTFFDLSYLSFLGGSVERNINLASQIEGDYVSPTYGSGSYPFRLLGNVANLGMRPQLLDEHLNLYLLNVGFWQFGFCLMAGLIWSCCKMLKGSKVETAIASIILFAIMAVSFGSFVQPRYLMPLLMWLSLGLVWRWWWIAVFICLTGSVVFFTLDLLPPLQIGLSDVNWDWQ
jgi:hypothetical protein